MPFALARRSQPVQRTVGQSVVEPLSVLNDLVSGVLAKDKGKHRLHLAVYHVHRQPVGVDILFQQLRAWVIVPPHWVGLPFFAMNSRARA